MERWACEIRLRAEHKAGELLKEREMAQGGRPTENPSHTARGSDQQTLADFGISYTQSSRWQIRLRAERKAGILLRQREMAKGSAQPGVGRAGQDAMWSQDATTLADLGISKTQSSRWQRLAEMPEEEFEAKLSRTGGRTHYID